MHTTIGEMSLVKEAVDDDLKYVNVVSLCSLMYFYLFFGITKDCFQKLSI